MSDENRERPGQEDAGAPGADASEPDREPMGGDPPCWAHLFGEDPGLTAEELDAPDLSDAGERPDA